MYPAIESRSFLFDFLSCFLCNLLFRIKEYQTSYWKGFNELRIRGEKLWEANEEAIKADVRLFTLFRSIFSKIDTFIDAFSFTNRKHYICLILTLVLY